MYGFTLSDEQQAFVEAIRDLARRECGTREQRDALTKHNTEPHNPDMYKRVAELGWLGVAIPTEFGGSGGGPGRPVPVPGGDLPRTGPDRRLLGQRDQRRPIRALRHRRAEAGDPHGDRRRRGGGDRDVRARGRLGRRQPALQGRATQRRLRDQRPEDVDLRGAARRAHPARVPHRDGLGQAQGADDAVGPRRLRGGRDPRHRDDGRQGRQRRVLQRLRGPGRQPRGCRRPGLDAADERPEHRAADHRRAVHRPRPAGARRRARLHQGARTVRTPDRVLPGAQPSTRRPRHRGRVHTPADVRGRASSATRTPACCSRRRPRWRS